MWWFESTNIRQSLPLEKKVCHFVGGVTSPILANIYLHELDELMEQKKQEFDRGKVRQRMAEWNAVSVRMQDYRRKAYALQGDQNPNAIRKREAYVQQVEELSALQKRLPATDPLDPTFRRLFYTRYADDYLIGIIGSKQEAEQVFKEVKNFLNISLKLEIAEEKSGIHHAKKGTTFLGYVVKKRTTAKMLKMHRPTYTKVVATRRTVRDRIHLRVPQTKMSEFCQVKGYGNYEKTEPLHRTTWLAMDDEEILLAYNAEMRGIANYYALAKNVKGGLNNLIQLATGSFLATLANKHNSSVAKMAAKLRQGNDLVVTTYTKEGKPRRYTLFKLRNWKPPQPKEDIDKLPSTVLLQVRTSLEQRLNANVCEFCGKEGGYFEVHHVRKLKDVVGKEPWKQIMIARKRKTIVLCIECHDKLHAGTLSYGPKKF